MIYLNNLQNFNHAEAYGSPRAFYDLRVDQVSQLSMVRDSIGSECCVFSYADNGKSMVRLDYWTLLSVDDEISDIEDKGQWFRAHALRGEKDDSRSRIVPKSEFAELEPSLFNCNGHFKRRSVFPPNSLTG